MRALRFACAQRLGMLHRDGWHGIVRPSRIVETTGDKKRDSDVAGKPSEVMFYHLETQSLEAVLPTLLEKTLARGWRAVVQAGSDERLAALDLALWTYREDSFLPHGTAAIGASEHQPVFLTVDDDAPNGAGIRFLVDGATASAFDQYERLVYLFDGADDEAVANARGQWKAAKAAGCAVTYWQQAASGQWEKKAG